MRERSGSLRPSLCAMKQSASGQLRHERVLGGSFGLRCLPGSAEKWKQEAVESDVAGGLPGEDERDREDEQDWVAAGAPSEHEVHVHERTREGSHADERSKDQSDTDGGLAEGHDLAHEDLGVVVDEELDEAAVPVVEDHRLGGRGGHGGDPVPEGQEPRAVDDVVALRSGVRDLVPTDRKSTRLNSSHLVISYAVFCLKKKKIYNDYVLLKKKKK